MRYLPFKTWDAFRVYLLLEGSTALFFGMIFTLDMVYHVTAVGLNPLQLVLVGTMLETVVFVFEVPTGIVADVYSRRLSIIIGVILIGGGFIIEGLFPYFGVVLLSQLFWGLGATFTSGATQAWIADEVGEKRAGQAFLRGAQVGQIGGLIGIAGSIALGSIRVQVPIVTGGVLFVALGGLLLLVMPENGFIPAPREERGNWQSMVKTLHDGVCLIRGRGVLLILVGVSALHGLSSEGWDRLWAAHILQNFSLPRLMSTVVWFGVINAITMLLSLVMTEIVRRQVDVNYQRAVAQMLLFLHTLIVVGMLIFGLASRFGLALAAFLLVQTLRGTVWPLLNAWVNPQIDSEVRATVFSMSSQINAIGQIAGGPVVGWIGMVGSLRAALVMTSAILSPVVVLLLRAMGKAEPVPEPAAGD